MASRFSLEAVFRAIDKFSSPMKKITGSTKKFTRAIKKDFAKAQRQVNNFARNFKRNLGRNILVGVGIAVAAITGLAVKSSQAWDIQAAAIKNVEAGLESTAGVAGRTLAQLEKQAVSLQKNTFIGDEKILQGVTAQMLTFTNVTESRFDRAQQAVIDITAKLNGLNVTQENLKSISLATGKALNAPVQNLGALGRMGIQFSKEQKETIKVLASTGQVAKAQEIILAEIEKQYGGTAAALAKTAGGMQASLKNMGGDMLELIGKGIEPLRLKFLEFLSKILPKLLPIIEKFTNFIEKNADAIFETFINVASTAWNVLKTFGKVSSTVFNILKPFAPIIMGIVAAFIAYKATLIVAAIVQAIMAVTGNAMLLPIYLIVIAIGILIALIIIVIKNWKKIITVLKKAWGIIKKTGKGIWNNLVKGLKKVGDWISKNSEIFSVFFGPLAGVVGIIDELILSWDKIVEKFKEGDILGAIVQIGRAMLAGLLVPVQGLLELFAKIPGLEDIAGGAAEKIKKIREDLRGFEVKEKKEGEGKKVSVAPITPAERSATILKEEKTTGELIIKDETGRAVIGKGKGSKKKGYNIRLKSSAAFGGVS
jgi:uncharacterized protein YoxC